jgi:hypothetical protein
VTCRCVMCGAKNADRVGRRSYAQAGVNTSEQRATGDVRRRERRRRRRVEKRNYNATEVAG